MNRRVVITGLGVASPNGVGLTDFTSAIKNGKSGIEFYKELEELNFSCQIGGIPPITDELKNEYFTPLQLRGLNSTGILYGGIAGMQAWNDAGLSIYDEANFDVGVIFGAGILGADKYRNSIYKVDQGKTRKLGSTVVTQIMTSGVSAFLAGKIGAGNIVTTNSSACSTGTEAVIMAYERIARGQAECILAGSTSESGKYIWAGFDAMRVMPYQFNDDPEKASRPMSNTASGFVPGSGAGALVLESLESAQNRNATIYAEVLGGHANSGGHRSGGSMTAPNPIAIHHCITSLLEKTKIDPNRIDLINGHLTATKKDPNEIECWAKALGRSGDDFPYINSLKSMTGHCLAASGSIECVASVLQIKDNFIFPSINSEDLHPEIEKRVTREKIPLSKQDVEINTVIKASFGFGDVNACVLFRKF